MKGAEKKVKLRGRQDIERERSVGLERGPRGGDPSGPQVVDGFDRHQCHFQDLGD